MRGPATAAFARMAHARDRLRDARRGFVTEPPLAREVCRQARSAALASLHGFLLWNERAPEAALEAACDSALGCDETLAPIVEHTRSLAALSESPALLDAEEALRVAEVLYESIKLRLPSEAQP